MRLICPNCAAQYEVDAQMIPETGRDVQCSNCGRMWFQAPDGADPDSFVPPAATGWDAEDLEDEGVADEEPAAIAAGSEPRDAFDTAPDREDALSRWQADSAAPVPDQTPVAALGSRSQADEDLVGIATPQPALPDEDVYEDELGGTPLEAVLPASAAGATVAPRPRRNLNEAVLSVLREEAEREARARRAAATATFERQSELPLDEAPAPRRRFEAAPDPVEVSAPEPLAAPTAEREPEIADEPAAIPRAVARRDLLPDIEEINSTLRATSERGDEHASIDAPETLRRQRSGFRLGFGLMLALAVLVLGFYRLGPALAESVPALAGPVQAGVAAIDAARVWLNRLLAP
ncbi:zinc-ribbon domain-containing protein [Frigidibacter sp. MR17.14]|uniref:zinc-ribbon domain-containing protein n=1 Tax=Frigidibacter sp. MR17.14 TaxID=3126509 RepID=UPI003012E7E5